MKDKEVIFDLGEHFVSGFTDTFEEAFEGQKYPLKLVWSDKLNCPVLSEQPPFEMMWGEYWYQSGINGKMVKDLGKVVDSIDELLKPQEGDIWLDIASNDGTLLKMVNDKFYKVGCDPVQGVIAQLGEANSHKFINDYFSAEVYSKNVEKKARVITCCAMFYDLQDPAKFLMDVFNCLDEDGVFVMQFTHTPMMLRMGDFMNICHEHYAYHDFSNVYRLLENVGFTVFDAELNDVNGGSIRIYSGKKLNFLNIVKEKIGGINVQNLFYLDNMNNDSLWRKFLTDVAFSKFILRDFIFTNIHQGKSVWGYGASTKANTLLQYFELDFTHIIKIAEANPDKYGKFTKGSGIEICSEEEWRDAQPDVTIVFPFQFIDYFIKREKEYLDKGGIFVVTCPIPYIITKDGRKELAL